MESPGFEYVGIGLGSLSAESNPWKLWRRGE